MHGPIMNKATRLLATLVLLLAAPACSSGKGNGGGGGDTPDAGGGGGTPDGGGGGIPDAGGGGAADSGPSPDGSVNAACDYTEADDAGNDIFGGGSAEASSITFSAGGGEKVICGSIDPANMDTDVGDADGDAFQFTVDGAAEDRIPMRVVMTAPNGDTLTNFAVLILPTGGSQFVSGDNFSDGFALAGNYYFKGGESYEVVVVAGNDPLPNAPVSYEVHIGEALPCDAAAGQADFTEANENPNFRDNDIVSVNYAGDPVYALTTADDTPEATGLTLTPDTNVHLAGKSGDVTADGDSYLDRDTFLLGTDTDVNEVTVRLTWPDGDVDMDTYAFEEDTADPPIGGATMIDTAKDEVFTMRVTPETNLWLWAAAYDDTGNGGDTDLAIDYDITVCPRNFTP